MSFEEMNPHEFGSTAVIDGPSKPKPVSGITTPTRVLIAEDEFDIRFATSLRLKAAGFDVDGVENGEECLRRLDQSHYDVVLMDIRMPKMDGLTAMSRMSSDPAMAHIPVIVVSASMDDQEHALDGGARYFIRKPFASESLQEAITSACEGTDLNR